MKTNPFSEKLYRDNMIVYMTMKGSHMYQIKDIIIMINKTHISIVNKDQELVNQIL